jgi:hypothetical protein
MELDPMWWSGIPLHGVVCKSDITTPMKHHSTIIASLRVVQQKHMRVQDMSIELQLRFFTEDQHSLLNYNEVRLQINSRRKTHNLILSRTLFIEYLSSYKGYG